MTPELAQQLREEQGIVYSDGHFRKTHSGHLFMDDVIAEAEQVAVMDNKRRLSEKIKAIEGTPTVEEVLTLIREDYEEYKK